jgi:hypothetical protein
MPCMEIIEQGKLPREVVWPFSFFFHFAMDPIAIYFWAERLAQVKYRRFKPIKERRKTSFESTAD